MMSHTNNFLVISSNFVDARTVWGLWHNSLVKWAVTIVWWVPRWMQLSAGVHPLLSDEELLCPVLVEARLYH
jgi:hypothetical protein